MTNKELLRQQLFSVMLLQKIAAEGSSDKQGLSWTRRFAQLNPLTHIQDSMNALKGNIDSGKDSLKSLASSATGLIQSIPNSAKSVSNAVTGPLSSTVEAGKAALPKKEQANFLVKMLLSNPENRKAVLQFARENSKLLMQEGWNYLKQQAGNTDYTKYAVPASALLMMGLSGMFGGSRGRSVGGQLAGGALGAGLGWLASTRGGKDTLARAGRWQHGHTGLDINKHVRTGVSRLDNWLSPPKPLPTV